MSLQNIFKHEDRINKRLYRYLIETPDIIQLLKEEYNVEVECKTGCIISMIGNMEAVCRAKDALHSLIKELIMRVKDEFVLDMVDFEILNREKKFPKLNFSDISVFIDQSKVKLSVFGRKFDVYSFRRYVEREYEEVISSRPDVGVHLGVLVIGEAGQGKSTLVNTLCPAMMETGFGRHVTNYEDLFLKNIDEFRHPTLPFYFFDTEGFKSFSTTGNNLVQMKKYCEYIHDNKKTVDFLFYVIDGSKSRWDEVYHKVLIDETIQWFEHKGISAPEPIFIIGKCDKISPRKFLKLKKLIFEDFGNEIPIFGVSDQRIRQPLPYPRECPMGCISEPILKDQTYCIYECRDCSLEFSGCPLCKKPRVFLSGQQWICSDCRSSFANLSQENEIEKVLEYLVNQLKRQSEKLIMECKDQVRELKERRLKELKNSTSLDTHESEECKSIVHITGGKIANNREKIITAVMNFRLGTKAKVYLSVEIIVANSAIAAGIGGFTLPVSDAILIGGVQIGMIAELVSVWDFRSFNEISLKRVFKRIIRTIWDHKLVLTVIETVGLLFASFLTKVLCPVLGNVSCAGVAAVGTSIIGIIMLLNLMKKDEEGQKEIETSDIKGIKVSDMIKDLEEVFKEKKEGQERNKKIAKYIMRKFDEFLLC